MVLAGRMISVHRGVHVLTDRETGVGTRAMAASLTTGADAHACLETAAILHRWLDDWPGELVRIAMDPRTKTRQALTGVERHWHAVDAGDVRRFGALSATGHAATVRDLALHRPTRRMVAILDSALHRRQIDPLLVAEVAAGLPPHRARWLPLLDARSESPLESEVRVELVVDGLQPEPQLEVRVAGRRYRLDLPFPRWQVNVECDGEGFHGSPEAVHADRVRQADLAHAGWLTLRVTWRDLRDPQPMLNRVRRALTDRGCPGITSR
jgi:very-short-patch-repair endonuclease